MRHRRRPATLGTALLTLAILTTAGCGGTAGNSRSEKSGSTRPSASGAASAAASQPPAAPALGDAPPLSGSALRGLLLTQTDLGPDYSAQPASSGDNKHDDVGMQGCPALQKLDAANLQFATSADASFTYNGDANSELDEELASDSPAKLATDIREISQAWTACPSFTMTSGQTPISVTTSQTAAPKLGDQQFGVVMTMTGATTSVMEEVVIRKGNVALFLSGAPGLVDNHLAQAVNKLQRQS